MSTPKLNHAQRLAFTHTKKLFRDILKKRNIKGVKMKIVLEQDAHVLKIYGLPDDVSLAKWEIERHTHYQHIPRT
jgi:hypothetical protein